MRLIDAEVEALILELRRQHPRWGARRVRGHRRDRRDPGRASRGRGVHHGDAPLRRARGVLSDSGKQFTGRPFPAEVLFERVCRENGVSQRLTKRGAPTTTDKIERFHKTLGEELLDQVTAFDTLNAARGAIDAWVRTYNHI